MMMTTKDTNFVSSIETNDKENNNPSLPPLKPPIEKSARNTTTAIKGVNVLYHVLSVLSGKHFVQQ